MDFDLAMNIAFELIQNMGVVKRRYTTDHSLVA